MYVSVARAAYGPRLLSVLALNLVCAVYVAKVVRQRKAGWSRFLPATPVLLYNCAVAACFLDDEEVVTKSVFMVSSFWVSNFKLLALCLDRGSLTLQHPWTFCQFAALYLMPITPRSQLQDSASQGTKTKLSGSLHELGGGTSELTTRFLAKSLTLAGLTHALTTYGDGLSPLSTHVLYAITLYAFLGLGYDGLAALATSMIGLEIAPHFDKPFFSRSFTNMWGRRWNMSIGNTLRVLIYDPILEGELIKTEGQKAAPNSMFRRWLGVCGCFFVSGVMHEVIYRYAENRFTIGWKWFTFFMIQAVIIGIEGPGRRLMKRYNIAVPKLLAVVITVTLQMWLAHILFFPPCTDADMIGKVMGGLLRNFQAVQALFMKS